VCINLDACIVRTPGAREHVCVRAVESMCSSDVRLCVSVWRQLHGRPWWLYGYEWVVSIEPITPMITSIDVVAGEGQWRGELPFPLQILGRRKIVEKSSRCRKIFARKIFVRKCKIRGWNAAILGKFRDRIEISSARYPQNCRRMLYNVTFVIGVATVRIGTLDGWLTVSGQLNRLGI